MSRWLTAKHEGSGQASSPAARLDCMVRETHPTKNFLGQLLIDLRLTPKAWKGWWGGPLRLPGDPHRLESLGHRKNFSVSS